MKEENETLGDWETMMAPADWGSSREGAGVTLGDMKTMGWDEAGIVLAGRYRVVKRLGEGGMGSVWLAEDGKLDGRKVAVKMLPAVLAGKKGAYRQVKSEALMAMKLSHPNIATVRAFEEDEGGNPFLVMDYIEGEGLDDILAEKGALGEEETVRLLGPVATALDYAHSQGVVHRDVKPGNVMVRKDGTPFVLDFGIAREVQETMTRVTGKLSSGTLLYMSPEQLRGRGPKPAQDVYSFAAMAYECLTGQPPFARGQIEWQIVNEAPEELPESVGEGLRKGVMAGLAKEAGERPGTCTEVLGGAGRNGAWGREEEEDGGGGGQDEASGTGEPNETEGADGDPSGGQAARGCLWVTILAGVIFGVLQCTSDLEKQAKDEQAARAKQAADQAAETARITRKLRSGETRSAGATRRVSLGRGETMEMAWCPPGCFMMGSPDSEPGREANETQHQVTLTKGFWMAKTEVTQAQWESVMGGNPPQHKGNDLPVERVNQEDCAAFCEKAGLALPTEAEWEYACRAGSTGAYGGTGAAG